MKAERLCLECLTIDPSFPLKPGCKSCAEALANDEFLFWNTPVVWEEEMGITPRLIMRRVRQPWKAFFNLITLGG